MPKLLFSRTMIVALLAGLFLTTGPKIAWAKNRLGIEYYLLAMDDPDMRRLLDNPKIQHIILDGSFSITQGLELKVHAGWGQVRISNAEMGSLGAGDYGITNMPAEVGLRFNLYDGEIVMPYLAAGPGAYFMQFRNTNLPDSQENQENLVGFGGWLNGGLDLRFGTNLGLTAQIHYVVAQAEIKSLHQKVGVGGPGFRAGVLFFF